jgi:hypothetical protein
MKMTTDKLLLADSPTGRICTTCSQRVRTQNITQNHFDLIV